MKFFLKFFFAYSANTSLKFGRETPPYWLAEILAIICIAIFIAVPTEFGWQTSALVILVPFLSMSSILNRQQLVSLVSTSESCQCIVFFLWAAHNSLSIFFSSIYLKYSPAIKSLCTEGSIEFLLLFSLSPTSTISVICLNTPLASFNLCSALCVLYVWKALACSNNPLVHKV